MSIWFAPSERRAATDAPAVDGTTLTFLRFADQTAARAYAMS
jgi:hypothetical protein